MSLRSGKLPFVRSEDEFLTIREEILASYLYQVHLYQWLEENGFGSADQQRSMMSAPIRVSKDVSCWPTQFLRTTMVTAYAVPHLGSCPHGKISCVPWHHGCQTAL